MEKLKLGIIGLSEGNGHPYSWAAICNGFDRKHMKDCPFPVIPEYLAKEKYPDNYIQDAVVSHIWTQDKVVSKEVALASRIENVVDDYHEMLGVVDGILLARDDAENHYDMCKDFITAGMMVYIDKPLAFDIGTAGKIFALERFEGQIFSCSAMKYARELDESMELVRNMGEIDYIEATVMKRWETYSAHIIDPLLRIIGDDIEIVDSKKIKGSGTQGVILSLKDGKVISLLARNNENTPLSIRLFGRNDNLEISFDDTFYAFREALRDFIRSIRAHKSTISKKHIMKMVEIIDRGL